MTWAVTIMVDRGILCQLHLLKRRKIIVNAESGSEGSDEERPATGRDGKEEADEGLEATKGKTK